MKPSQPSSARRKLVSGNNLSFSDYLVKDIRQKPKFKSQKPHYIIYAKTDQNEQNNRNQQVKRQIEDNKSQNERPDRKQTNQQNSPNNRNWFPKLLFLLMYKIEEIVYFCVENMTLVNSPVQFASFPAIFATLLLLSLEAGRDG